MQTVPMLCDLCLQAGHQCMCAVTACRLCEDAVEASGPMPGNNFRTDGSPEDTAETCGEETVEHTNPVWTWEEEEQHHAGHTDASSVTLTLLTPFPISLPPRPTTLVNTSVCMRAAVRYRSQIPTGNGAQVVWPPYPQPTQCWAAPSDR